MAVACMSPLKPSDPPPLDLDALEALAASATPGPWRSTWDDEKTPDDLGEDQTVVTLAPGREGIERGVVQTLYYDGLNTGCNRDDAAFIAAMNPDVARALIARIRELEAALATATQTERARCLAICRNRQHARSKHSQQLREEGSHDRSIWVHCKSTEAAACADEIERGHIPPTQETT